MREFNHSTSMLIGETTGGLSMPVFFDTHTPIYNNKPPGILITGQPGSGKSFLAMTMTTICAILGKTTIVLDPKGDFLSLYSLESQIGEVNFWNLSEPRNKGILDPFYLANERGEQLGLVVSVIEMFVGGLSSSELSALSPIVKDVQSSNVPSLLAVTEALETSENETARNLGARLDMIRHQPFAHLCFAPGTKKRAKVRFDKGVTIVTMPGLDLVPSDSREADASSKMNSKRLSHAIFFLITDFIRRVMNDDSSPNPKTLIIDEAWAVLATDSGAECIKAVARLGRSKKLALVLVTQNTSDIEAAKIDNTITTRFAFSTDSKEAEHIVSSMKLPEGEGFEENLLNLQTGECLMMDFLGRYSTVQITNWRKDWAEAFESNPYKKMQAQKARKSR